MEVGIKESLMPTQSLAAAKLLEAESETREAGEKRDGFLL
jgi:hypothetical protein